MGRHRLGRCHRTTVHQLVHVPQNGAVAAEQPCHHLVLHRRQILHLVDDQMTHGSAVRKTVGTGEGQSAQQKREGVLPFHHPFSWRFEQGALARVGQKAPVQRQGVLGPQHAQEPPAQLAARRHGVGVAAEGLTVS